MAIVTSLLKGVVKYKRRSLDKRGYAAEMQQQVLRQLLKKAAKTEFGKQYEFEAMANKPELTEIYSSQVPVFDYEKIFNLWWHRLLKGEPNITWPGKVRFFGLTSGTSNDASKRVPVTQDMIKAIRKIGIRQLLALAELDLPESYYQKGILMLGGSTNLVRMQDYFEGDLSGILAGNLPFWFNRFYKPGKEISKVSDWEVKLEKIVDNAYKWDIGGIAGVPAWVQILIEKIIDRYGLENIHQIWPNFRVYSHGGVSFEPYRKSFEKLLGDKVYFLETYLASEGFFAYQHHQNRDMQLVLDNGVYYEFIPFNTSNFTSDGSMVENPQTLNIGQVQEGVEYAMLISTCAGAWRYLIGDTIKFTRLDNYEIAITGRTKHFLSLCGEHLSVDNMTKAVSLLSDEFDTPINEFTVAGIKYQGLFAHKWFLGVEDPSKLNPEVVKERLEALLKPLNDD